MRMLNLIKSSMKSVIKKIFHRRIVYLSVNNQFVLFEQSKTNILPLLYTYRAFENAFVTYEIQLDGNDLSYTLFTIAFSDNNKWKKNQLCLTFELPFVKRGDIIKVNLIESLVWHNNMPVQIIVYTHEPSRKFTAEICLANQNHKYIRSCSHYLAYENKVIDRDYYHGDDYVNYPNQTNKINGLNIVKHYVSEGKLLDVGCAMGVYTNAFIDAGYDAYGVDISDYAINQAISLGRPERFMRCNIDQEGIPFEFYFDIFWVWDVLEHSINPFNLLEKITKKANQDAYLFLHTSNSKSLTHLIMGVDWEGFSDYSHFGVEKVAAESLKRWLGILGWQILEWKCDNIWVEGIDTVMLRLQESFHKLPELRTFLLERNLGDAIYVVARRTPR